MKIANDKKKRGFSIIPHVHAVRHFAFSLTTSPKSFILASNSTEKIWNTEQRHTMKRTFLLASVFAALTMAAINSPATIYGDATGDGALVGAGGGILSITSVEGNNTAPTLYFYINLPG